MKASKALVSIVVRLRRVGGQEFDTASMYGDPHVAAREIAEWLGTVEHARLVLRAELERAVEAEAPRKGDA